MPIFDIRSAPSVAAATFVPISDAIL